MKKFFVFSLFALMTSILSAQTIENIQVEQDGEKLNIHYRIGGSTSEQLYFVTLTCSIDNGAVFEPKTVIGDVGTNIRGGKSFNTIVWDVFKDVEEIGSIEFFVKVDLESDESKDQLSDSPVQLNDNADQISKNQIQTINGIPVSEIEKNLQEGGRKIFVGIAGSVVHPLGVRVATMGNWGGYVHFRYGGWDPVWEYYLIALEAGATKRIMNRENFRLHGYLGVGLGDYLDEFEIDYGVLGVFNNRFTLGLGGNVNQWYPDANVSIGIVF